MDEYIGTMTLGDKVDITDPCYDKDIWCRITTECKPGEYYGYINEMGDCISSIGIFKDNAVRDVDSMERIGSIGVDAGLAGFFNNKPDYSNDEWDKFLEESGVFKDGQHYSCECGLFSNSGYGDGSYDVYATKERDAFVIVFIDDKDDDEDEDDDGCWYDEAEVWL